MVSCHGKAHFDPSLSGWGDFSFFIGILPPAYTYVRASKD